MEMKQQVVPSSSTLECTYDVFLSFRGEDTRYGFTGNLYSALEQRGFKTFMDDEGLSRGEEISSALFKAIEESRIFIIVFSKRYSSSKWCLEELVKIMECSKAKERVVYPVFYNVEPSDLREKGSYEKDLAKVEEKLKDGNKEKVQKWRLTLLEASYLAGWCFRDGYEYEYGFIKQIIQMLSRNLNRNLLHVADYPVGLESRADDVISRLRLHIPTASVIMVGICGIGGIGKTTVARTVYNFIGHEFEGLCFLPDVRETSTKHGLVHLQEAILSDILGENDMKLGDVHKGIPILIRKLQCKRVLLILDDVDKLEQLKKLAGGCNWFGSGSRIIITSRRKDILSAHGIHNIYDVPKLCHSEALELLSWNASKRSKVDPGYNAVWNRAVLYSHGHPLVLNVIGSDLLGKSADEWEFALDRYAQIPNEEIHSVLKVSYDSLNECEKIIFLDIACFFTGATLPYVEEILSACGLYPKYGIAILIDRSLVSITHCGRLTMHDLLKDMAIEIVRQESPLNPAKRSRLWFYEDVLQVLAGKEGTDKIEGIVLDYSLQGKVLQLSDKAFKKMKSLRILIIKNASFTGSPKHLPNSLRVLDWRGYPSRCLPPDFHPTNLTILNLPCSNLILDKLKNMPCLTRMDFTDCKFLSEVPDLSGVPNLRTLYLDNCTNLIKIHDSAGVLVNLKELTAAGCTNLETIPFAFKLASLRLLCFSECPRLNRFPEILCKIEGLRHVNLWQTAIEELPFSIGNLVGLESLTLMECAKLDKLPCSIFTLPRLQEIQADSCRGFGISNECEGHELLQLTVSPNKISLNLSSCNLIDEHLVICLIGFANVVYLDLSLNNFTVLPACIEECIHLKTLMLTNCKQLRDISVVPPKLNYIDALNCTSFTSQSSSVLLSQAFHETGDKTVMLPGSRIPKWFDHCSKERSVTFWARKRFPRICVCVAFGMLEHPPHEFYVRICVLINGERWIVSQSCYSWSIVTEHVWLFDLSALVRDSNLREAFRDQSWKHVEVLCEDCQEVHSMQQAQNGPTRMSIVKWYGIHAYRQENRMEDILFTNVKTLHERNTNFERFSEDNHTIAPSMDDGAFHDRYYHSESGDDLEISCYPLCKRQCR